MAKYINSNQEFYWGDWYFKSHVMPADFDYKARKKELSPFYGERGFKVSMMFFIICWLRLPNVLNTARPSR